MSQFWQFRQRKPQPAVASEKRGRAGQEVQERLLLDRIDVQRARIGVGQRVELAVLVDAVAAVAAVLGLQQALVGAELALDVLAQLQVVPGLAHPARACHGSQSSPGGVAREHVRRRQRLSTAQHVVHAAAAGRNDRQPTGRRFEKVPPRSSRVRIGRSARQHLGVARSHVLVRFAIHPHRLIAK